jgi:ABC-type branched-subunit amino acid transport system substrate-binding protein
LVGCTSGGSSGKSDSTSPQTTTAPSATGPAPGVTADSVKIGVTYVDTESLKKVGLNYDLGDWAGAYKALIAEINKAGGINGRTISPIYVPIDPTGPSSAQAACVKLTEDDDVFLVSGFFVADGVNCFVTAPHATAVVGGDQTSARLKNAKAPWVSNLPGAEQPARVIQALKDNGSLDGKVGVFVGQSEDTATLNNDILPALEAAGVTPVETAVMDAPVSDTAAIQNKVNLIAQKFEASGVDTVVIGGLAGANWPQYMASNPYRPKLRFLSVTGARSFVTNASTTDTSILKDSIAGGPYGPDQAIFEEPKMQACIKTLTAAGIKTPAPNTLPAGDMSNQPFQAAFNVCPVVDLLKGLLEKAGKTLNYGTLTSAIDGLQVNVSGDPTQRVYGPTELDGNAKAYLFTWDEAKKLYVAAPTG